MGVKAMAMEKAMEKAVGSAIKIMAEGKVRVIKQVLGLSEATDGV
jgi:hypothetical protein